MQSTSTKKVAAWLGISAVGLFAMALIVFVTLNPNFNYLEDFVSKLGAIGQPFSLWWNLIGFLAVGVLLAAFGLAYGRVVEDRMVGILLTLFGIGACTFLAVNCQKTAYRRAFLKRVRTNI